MHRTIVPRALLARLAVLAHVPMIGGDVVALPREAIPEVYERLCEVHGSGANDAQMGVAPLGCIQRANIIAADKAHFAIHNEQLAVIECIDTRHYCLFFTGLTALALLYLIAAWAIVTGMAGIASAVRLRREMRNEWLYIISGVLSILFGAALVIFPGAGALAVVWLVGLYALLFGVVLIGLGLRLRGMRSVPTNQLNQSSQLPASA